LAAAATFAPPEPPSEGPPPEQALPSQIYLNRPYARPFSARVTAHRIGLMTGVPEDRQSLGYVGGSKVEQAQIRARIIAEESAKADSELTQRLSNELVANIMAGACEYAVSLHAEADAAAAE